MQFIGRTSEVSVEQASIDMRAREGAPDVVVIVLDDVGFAHPACFGSDIATPELDRLAADGLRYVSFQATPMCGPTRACLMTGRQAHAVGMGVVANSAFGFPGYSGRLSRRAATLAETLRLGGYGCFALGKWHLAPVEHWGGGGPFDYWPLQRGFDRYYGFIESATDQWHPELVEGNTRIRLDGDLDYHLTEDLVDRSIGFIHDHITADGARPFFLYLALGACHSPLQAPRPFIDHYRGRYDRGWDRTREQWFARQQKLGIVPKGTRLAPRNPGVEPWDVLSADQKRLYARYQEVFAGFLEHTDREIGRLMRRLEEIGRSENTLVVVVSDNGAADNGGPHGWAHHFGRYHDPESALRDGLAAIDRLGDDTTKPMYPRGWAQVGNTPFRHYKIDTYAGGTSVPLIVRWPERIREGGAIRRQYHHAVDLYPTILEAAGVTAPETYGGISQLPVHGVSMSYTFDEPDAQTRKRVQYFENFGHRAIWQDGWKAVTKHRSGDDYATEPWALYDLTNDFSEYEDLAATHPEKLRELIELWWAEAGRYDVLPLDDRPGEHSKRIFGTPRSQYVYFPNAEPVSSLRAPVVADRSHVITAEIETKTGDEGVILSVGGKIGGYVLYVQGGHAVYEYNTLGNRCVLRSTIPIPAGRTTLRFSFTRTGPLMGVGALSFGGEPVGSLEFPEMLPDLVPPGPVNCGRDDDSPVSTAYRSPFRFTGRLLSVVVEPAV